MSDDVKITAAQGRACLEAMRRDAVYPDRLTSDALEAIGWCLRGTIDWFKWSDPECTRYERGHFLLALAWCVTLSGVKP